MKLPGAARKKRQTDGGVRGAEGGERGPIYGALVTGGLGKLVAMLSVFLEVWGRRRGRPEEGAALSSRARKQAGERERKQTKQRQGKLVMSEFGGEERKKKSCNHKGRKRELNLRLSRHHQQLPASVIISFTQAKKIAFCSRGQLTYDCHSPTLLLLKPARPPGLCIPQRRIHNTHAPSTRPALITAAEDAHCRS